VATSFLRFGDLATPDVYVVVSPPVACWGWPPGWIDPVPAARRLFFTSRHLAAGRSHGARHVKPSTFTRSASYWAGGVCLSEQRLAFPGIIRNVGSLFRAKESGGSRQIYFPNPVTMPALTEFPAAGAFRARNGFKPEISLAVVFG